MYWCIGTHTDLRTRVCILKVLRVIRINDDDNRNFEMVSHCVVKSDCKQMLCNISRKCIFMPSSSLLSLLVILSKIFCVKVEQMSKINDYKLMK